MEGKWLEDKAFCEQHRFTTLMSHFEDVQGQWVKDYIDMNMTNRSWKQLEPPVVDLS